MATEEERAALVKMCFWQADCKSAKLFAMSTLMFHLVARSIEASSLLKSRLRITQQEDMGQKYDVISVDMERTKTGSAMAPHFLYPHRDKVVFDAYFAMAYIMVMDDRTDEDFLFPDFADKMSNSEGDINSKTSKLFNSYVEWISDISYGYGDESADDLDKRLVAIPNLKAHSMKKAGVNELADHLDFHTFLFCCGWMARNLHTAFDYIFNNEKKDSACGKVLAGWLMVDSNGKRRGGYPSKTQMDHESDKFDSFVCFLLFKDSTLNTEVAGILATTVLLFHDEFNSIIGNEPNGKWKQWQNHPFNQKILKAMSEAGE